MKGEETDIDIDVDIVEDTNQVGDNHSGWKSRDRRNLWRKPSNKSQ